jgi:endo-alpha-1,4-polygalactosaminidase (GH114 family)
MRALASFAIVLLLAFPALAQERPRDWQPPPLQTIPNFREVWRGVVVELAAYAKKRNPNFVVMIRGGVELMVKGEREAQWDEARDPAGAMYEKRLPLGWVFRPYLKAIDGMIFDGLYCGPYKFEKPLAQAIKERKQLDGELADERRRGIYRPPVPQPIGPFSLDPKVELARAAEVQRLAELEERQRRVIYAMDAVKTAGRPVFAIEDCATAAEAEAARRNGDRDGVLVFSLPDDSRLDRLPGGHARGENAARVVGIDTAKNWLPMLRGDRYAARHQWMTALAQTNYDVLMIDVVHRLQPLVKTDIAGLKYKALGAPRLVLANMPIGRAYDWRWYWQKDWVSGNPAFLFAPMLDQPGVFITDVRSQGWKELLGKYLAGIVDLGFDGVVFDDLDTYLWFEDMMPLDQ